MATLSKSTLFDPTLVADLINKVKGHSTLAKLCGQSAIPFNGIKEFTFTLDKEMDIVAENGAKSHGGATVAPLTIVPIKFEYGARVSDEFVNAAEEERINYLKAFNDGFAKKMGRALDIAAFQGLNPRTGEASNVVGNNCFDKAVTNTVAFDGTKADENIEDAIALLAEDTDVNGLAVNPAMRSALAAIKLQSGLKKFPELEWGGKPSMLGGIAFDANGTVSYNGGDIRAIVGDFQNAFKWGIAKEIPLEVIPYGDPDNSGEDLKGHNQVYLRTEVYMGWGILDKDAFSMVEEAAESES